MVGGLLLVKTSNSEIAEGKQMNNMTKRWLSGTSHPPRIVILFKHIKIHKPKPVGRPIISVCGGRIERTSAFMYHIAATYCTNLRAQLTQSIL